MEPKLRERMQHKDWAHTTGKNKEFGTGGPWRFLLSLGVSSVISLCKGSTKKQIRDLTFASKSQFFSLTQQKKKKVAVLNVLYFNYVHLRCSLLSAVSIK